MLGDAVEGRAVADSYSHILYDGTSTPSGCAEGVFSVAQKCLQGKSEDVSSSDSEADVDSGTGKFPARDSLDILGGSDEDSSEQGEGRPENIVCEDCFYVPSKANREESKNFEVESVVSGRTSRSSFSIAHLFRRFVPNNGHKAWGGAISVE